MMTVDDYLAIPDAYGRWLGGLRWSPNGEAVEYATTDPEIGLTFAMSAQIDPFLEGLATEGRTLHFAYVLHLLHLLGDWKRMASTEAHGPSQAGEFAALARAFHEAGRPLRNAGALCAMLCREIPSVPDPPRLARVRLQLSERSPMRYAILRTYPGEVPPLEPPEFEAGVRAGLRAFSADDLAHWLRHGRGPVGEAGEAVARVVPKTLGEQLAEVESRPRLRVAAGLVARLAGALALPPRRLAQAELPLGGYSVVANRGQPEQILPGQFALDMDEFLRRFAERELLYFHREEPHAPTAREMVLLVDQGVRTWGDVRVVLAAAALALGRLADRRGLLLRIATTGNEGEAVEAAGMGSEALGSLLEASDLTPSPAPALGRVLARGLEDQVPRDVLLLTHPRSLAEPDVAASARALAVGTRLFAVAVDPGGDVVLSELRHGAPVAIGRCRVEVGEGSEPATSPTESVPVEPRPWRGDVESIGFPFPIGATERIDDRLFAFDDAGGSILLADGFGMLRVWQVDGSGAEMLPRAIVEGRALGEVEAVVGVAGGFVVTGHVGGFAVAAHYDLAGRTCTAHVLGLPRVPMAWSYIRELHAVVACHDGATVLAIDLGAARDRATYPRQGNSSTRARDAYQRAEQFPPELLVIPEGDTLPMRGRALCLRPGSGAIGIREEPERWRQFIPLADGRPKFKGAQVLRARWHGDVLAVAVGLADGRRVLHAFSASDSWPSLGEFALARDVRDFALSRDGRRLAWRVGGRQIGIHGVDGAGLSPLITPKGRVHDRLDVEFHRKFLAVQAGRHAHLVRWDRGPLEFARTEGPVRKIVAREFEKSERALTRLVARVSEIVTSASLGGDKWRKDSYDETRFFATASVFGLKLAVDRLGQVAISGRSGLICMFFIFRDQIAAWAPDGTRLGPMSILGRPPTPDGAERIGAMLRAAMQDEGGDPS